MKIKLIVIAALSIIVFSNSCSKSDDVTAPPTTEEYPATWIGKYWQNSNTEIKYDYTIILKGNNKATIISGLPGNAPDDHYATGTYTEEGGILKMKYTYPNNSTFYVLAKIDYVSNQIDGVWGLQENIVDGNFLVTKQ